MALDGANFIAELSITDPPGSDPLSQGDDQIRTIKRATFQSFPLIAAAVNITDAQMNLMAIKDEANIFTVQNQSFLDETIFRRSAIGTFARHRWVDENSLVQWETYMAAGPGNNWLLQRRLDSVFVDVPISVSWTTGVVDFAHVPTVAGAPLWIAGEIRMFAEGTASIGTNWFVANGLSGTQDLTNRVVVGSGLSSAGTSLAPNLVGTAAAGTTGSTAISVAQMPVHGHDSRLITGNGGIGDVSVGFPSNETVMGGQRGVTGGTYARNNSSGNAIVRNEGSGSGHTHSSPSQAVTENGSDRNTVRPLSHVVEYWQYVP